MVMIYLISGLGINLTPLSLIYLLFINGWMVFCSRKNTMLLLIAVVFLYCNYSIIFANYINIIDNMFTEVINKKTFVYSFNILTIFHAFLALLVRWEKIPPTNTNAIFIDSRHYNFVIVLLTTVVLVPIFFLGFTISGIEGDRGVGSPLYEYSVIIFSILFYYSGLKKNSIILGLALLLPYILQNFVFGGHIEGIQFVLCAYLMLYMHRIKIKKLVPAIILLFLLLSLIGAVRGTLLSGNYDISSIFNALFTGGLSLDTAYSAYFTSETFVYVYDRLNSSEILYYLGEFVKSIFVGNSSCPDSVLGSVTYDYVSHWYGGILPFYFYFYFGPVGILLASIFVAFYLNLVITVNQMSSEYRKFIVVWVVCTVFRWYLYTPLVLLRGVLIASIVFILFRFLDTVLRHNKHIVRL